MCAQVDYKKFVRSVKGWIMFMDLASADLDGRDYADEPMYGLTRQMSSSVGMCSQDMVQLVKDVAELDRAAFVPYAQDIGRWLRTLAIRRYDDEGGLLELLDGLSAEEESVDPEKSY